MDIFPNFEHDTSQVNLRNIMMESINQNIEPIGYEDSLLHDMADDISKRLESQISAATSIAESSKSIAESASKDVAIQQEKLIELKKQTDSAESIANSAKTESELAIKKANSADIKGWIGTITGVLSFIVSVIALVLNYI